MLYKPQIIALSGSIRKESVNKKLLELFCSDLEKHGADVHRVDLAQYPMPLYNGDDEEGKGIPKEALKLFELFVKCDGFLIASPEYNSSITPLLKNTIDWISRPNQGSLEAYRGKSALLISASPGGMGGVRSLADTRLLLSNIYVHVFPDQFTLSSAYDAFDAANRLKDGKKMQRISALSAEFVNFNRKIAKNN